MESTEIRNLLHLQNIIQNLTPDNTKESAEQISDMDFSKTITGVRLIVNEIRRFAATRPLGIRTHVLLLKRLYEISDNEENFLSFIPEFLKELPNQTSTACRFVRYCMLEGLMNIDSIIQKLCDLSTEDGVFNFVFFADLIKLNNADIYNRMKSSITEKNGLHMPTVLMEKIVKNYEKFEVNDFKLLKPLILVGWRYDSIQFHASIDDVEFISDYASNNEFNFNMKIKLDKKYRNRFAIPLTENGTLLDFCAFYGSVKCFKYLLDNNAKLTDNVVPCAFAGGNHEIIQICEMNNLNMQKGLTCAIMYKRNDIFEWASEKFPLRQKNRNENFAAAAEFHSLDILLKLMQHPVDYNYERIPESIVDFDSLDLIKLFKSKGCNFRSLACVNTATKNRNTKIVEFLIENHAEFMGEEKTNKIPLIIAVNNNDYNTAKVLLESGADPNMCNETSSSLHIACKCSNATMVTLLLSYGAFVNVPDMNGNKPIIIASYRGNTEIVKVLIEHGAEYDMMPSNKEYSPLTAAASGGQLDTVKYLISIGCNPNEAAEQESLPIMVAKMANRTEVEKYLAELISDDIESMVSILFTDVKQMDFESVEKLVLKNTPLNRVDSKKRTVLHYAATTNRQIIELLARNGAAIDKRDADDMTPLHFSIVKDNLDCIKALVECGADINLLNNKGFTPLRLAVHDFNFEAVEYLLSKDADPNIEDFNDITPLIDVASTFKSEDRTKMLSMLLKANADPRKVDSSGHSALRILLRHNPTIEEIDLLVSFGSQVNSSTKKGVKTMYEAARLPPPVFMFLASIGGEVNAVCRNGDTALHAVAETEYIENAKLILSTGIQVNTMNKKKRTPIFNSVYFKVTSMIDFLISKGADINHVDIDKNTPLLISLKSDKPPTLSFIKFLVSRKINVKLANNFGETAKSIASGRGLTQIEEYIDTLL